MFCAFNGEELEVGKNRNQLKLHTFIGGKMNKRSKRMSWDRCYRTRITQVITRSWRYGNNRTRTDRQHARQTDQLLETMTESTNDANETKHAAEDAETDYSSKRTKRNQFENTEPSETTTSASSNITKILAMRQESSSNPIQKKPKKSNTHPVSTRINDQELLERHPADHFWRRTAERKKHES